MRKLLAIGLLAVCATAQAQVAVNGYVKKDGTYVAPHHRTAPDQSLYNNYSTQGNYNPYTGQAGTVNPYQVQPTYQAPAPVYQPYQPPVYKPYKY